MKHIKIFFFLALMTQTMWSQSITGKVFDLVTGTPLVGATVYYDGSSTGTITNDEGYFSIRPQLNSNSTLIITFIGYKTESIESNRFKEDLEIGMKEDAFSIPEVVLISDPFSRKQKLEVFRLEFLGESKIAKSCIIENEEDIELYFNSKDNTLKAYTQKPIIVINEFLGYKVKFNLIDFKIQFRQKSLRRIDNIKSTTIHVYNFFQDNTLGEDYYIERRAKVYYGSVQHFIRTTWKQNWNKENFEIRKNGRIVYPFDVFDISLGKDLNTKNIRLTDYKDKLIIKYKQGLLRYRSTMEVPIGGSFNIDSLGNYRPHNSIIFGGYMGEARVSELLPSEYIPLKN